MERSSQYQQNQENGRPQLAGMDALQALSGRNSSTPALPGQKTFVRYDEGASLYSMCRHTFMKLAAEAGSVYKVGRVSLVNTRIFEEYLEQFRVKSPFERRQGNPGTPVSGTRKKV